MKKEHKPKERKAVYTSYQYRGVDVCEKFFSFVNGVSRKELKNVRKSFMENGVGEVMHKNTRRCAWNKIIVGEMWEHVVTFIRSFGTQNGLILPGRIPQYSNFADLVVLPSSLTKSVIYNKYLCACSAAHYEPVSKRTWFRLWTSHCSNIVIQKPKTDLCVVCRNSITSFSRLHNLPDDEKKKQIEDSLEHLTHVENERRYYSDIIQECAENIPLIHFSLSLGHRLPCLIPGGMHYSFDFAQQISIPHHALQVGPIYFLSAYKVGLFGIAIEPIHKFILYVIPEAAAVSKGANAIISMLDHCLDNFSFGETDLFLHADNCVGQNKNNFVLQYLAYRVCKGLNSSVEMAHLPVGHTKFSPDAYFGQFKMKWRKSIANTVKDVCGIATRSKNTTVVMVGDERSVFVPTYDWSSYFKNKKGGRLQGLRLFHNFSTDKTNPGVLRYRKNSSVEGETTSTVRMFPRKVKFPQNEKPEVLVPTGLSRERQKYLYEAVREYVEPSARNILCPPPK